MTHERAQYSASMTEARPLTALVIGTTDGIGRALVRRLAGKQYRVISVSRRSLDDANALEDVEHHVLDAASDDFRAGLERVIGDRAIDLCVYCAGVGELFDATDLSMDARAARVNFVGLVDAAAAVIPAMVRRAKGHFVGLSSIGDGVSPEAPAYGASKAGASAYLEGIALALRSKRVHVTNMRFGFVDTKMAKSPVKPMMISVDEAVAAIERVIERRPMVSSYPKPMGWLVGALQWLLRLRLWVG